MEHNDSPSPFPSEWDEFPAVSLYDDDYPESDPFDQSHYLYGDPEDSERLDSWVVPMELDPPISTPPDLWEHVPADGPSDLLGEASDGSPPGEAEEETGDHPGGEPVEWPTFHRWVSQASQRSRELLPELASFQATYVPTFELKGVPSIPVCDVDGLCLVGLPSRPLSFLADPLPNDEDVFVCTSPRAAPKFAAGKSRLAHPPTPVRVPGG